MDLGYRDIDKATAIALPGAPDFAVLLACLSAAQAVTPTVRLQARERGGDAGLERETPLVALFAEGRKPDPKITAGRFSPGTSDDSER